MVNSTSACIDKLTELSLHICFLLLFAISYLPVWNKLPWVEHANLNDGTIYTLSIFRQKPQASRAICEDNLTLSSWLDVSRLSLAHCFAWCWRIALAAYLRPDICLAELWKLISTNTSVAYLHFRSRKKSLDSQDISSNKCSQWTLFVQGSGKRGSGRLADDTQLKNDSASMRSRSSFADAYATCARLDISQRRLCPVARDGCGWRMIYDGSSHCKTVGVFRELSRKTFRHYFFIIRKLDVMTWITSYLEYGLYIP